MEKGKVIIIVSLVVIVFSCILIAISVKDIAGLLLARETNTDVAQLPTTSAQEIPTKTIPTLPPVSELSWRKYIHPVYKYQIEYPSDWFVREIREGPEKDRRVDFTPVMSQTAGDRVPVTISLIVHDNPSNQSASQWVDKEIALLPARLKEQVSRESISVSSTRAEKVVGLPSQTGNLIVFLPREKYMYIIILTPYDLSDPDLIPLMPSWNTVFERMVSNLK